MVIVLKKKFRIFEVDDFVMALILSAVIFDMNIIDRFPSFLPLQTKMEKSMKSSCIVIADFAQRIGNLGDSLAVPETLYDSSITRPDPCLMRCYERIFRRIQELISHDFLDTLNHKRIFRTLRKQPTRKPYGFMQSSFWVIMMVHVMVCGDL